MMGERPAKPPAFPRTGEGFGNSQYDTPGMTLRDWFAGQALSNPLICTGRAETYQLTVWFGAHRTGITAAEIAARQAGEYADAMLAARAKYHSAEEPA